MSGAEFTYEYNECAGFNIFVCVCVQVREYTRTYLSTGISAAQSNTLRATKDSRTLPITFENLKE